MIAIGILVIALLIPREAPRENLNPDHLLEAIIVATVAGLLGARLLYVILNWSYYSTQPFTAFFTRFEGLSFYGGLFCGVLALLIWCSRRHIAFPRMADLLAPYLALGYAFGRIGCFLNGCCYGRESDLAWALPASAADTVLRHPVQLYAAAGALALFFLLKLLRPRRPFTGFVFLALLLLYGLLRFVTEFFRLGEAYWQGLTLAQLSSLGLSTLALAAIVMIMVAARRPPEKGAGRRAALRRKQRAEAARKEKPG